MGRIHRAYSNKFEALIGRLKARQIEKGVDWFRARAKSLISERHWTDLQSMDYLCERVRRSVQSFERRRDGVAHASSAPEAVNAMPIRFLCDAGLGGLARWIRAAGYDVLWFPGIADDELLKLAREHRATVLTSDSLMMERRVLRDKLIPSLWIPPTLFPNDQLQIVFREFGLSRREPRCMACGGALERVEKEAMRERIPPKTYRWLDKFFACRRCNQLFWRGTHWQRIDAELRKISK